MSKLKDFYNFIGEELFSWNELAEKYPYTEYYLCNKQDTFIDDNFNWLVADTLRISSYDRNVRTDSGRYIYTPFKRFVRVNEKDRCYREVELES